MCPHPDNSVAETLKLISGALTPVIALVVAWIAYQQYRVSRKKLQLDLYEKRYAVFRGLMELLSACLREANVSNSQLFKFLADTSEAEFLFDAEVPKYLTEAYLKANALHTAAFKLAGSALPVGEQRNRVVEEERAVLDWLSKQFEVSKKLFAPYLDFRKIK